MGTKESTSSLSANKQEQETAHELAEERVHELGQVQMREMDGATGRVGRSELTTGTISNIS